MRGFKMSNCMDNTIKNVVRFSPNQIFIGDAHSKEDIKSLVEASTSRHALKPSFMSEHSKRSIKKEARLDSQAMR